MSDFRQVSKGFFWNHIGRVCEYLLVYLFTVLIARSLGAAINGLYATFISLTQLLFIISSFGLETVAVSQLPKYSREDTTRLLVIKYLLVVRALFVVFVSIVFFVVGKNLASFLNIPLDLINVLTIVLIYFALQSIISLLSIIVVSEFQTKQISFIKVSIRTLELIAGFVIINSGGGLRGILMLISSTSCLMMFGCMIVLRGSASLNLMQRIDIRKAIIVMKPFLFFGGLIWVNGFFEFILSKQADIFILNYFFSDPIIVGQYDVATNFAQMINFGLTSGMYGVSIASFSSLSARKPALVPHYWEFLCRIVLFLLVPAFIVSLWFGEQLIPFVYSNSYYPSVILFQVLAFFLLITRMMGGGIAADYLQSMARPRILLVSSAASGIVNLVFAFVLIPKFGALGAILATGFGLLTIAAIHGYYVSRLLHVRLPFSFGFNLILLALCSSWLASLFLTLARFQNAILALVFFSLIYVPLIVLIKPLRYDDLQFFGLLPDWFMKWVKLVTRAPSKYTTLTDRQKWAFGWMSQSNVTVDIGSSISPLLAVLPEKSKKIIAIDIDRTSLIDASNFYPDVQVIESSTSNIPLDAEFCDTVLLLDVLEHVDDEQRTIGEIWRILKPDGELIISVPHRGLFRFLDPQNLSARIRRTYSKHQEHRHYVEKDLSHLLGPKFTIIRKHYGGLFLYPLTFAAENFFRKHFGVKWGAFFKKLGDWDNDISWGKYSYNLILKVRKVS